MRPVDNWPGDDLCVCPNAPIYFCYLNVIAGIFQWLSVNGFHFDLFSSTSQGHCWILVVFDLFSWLRVILSGRGGKDPFDKFRCCNMTVFVWYDVGCR